MLKEQTTAVVNVDDPHADPAEVAELRREGDRSLLMVPLVVQGRSLGLLEVVDQKRSRQYSRQEFRLAEAIAGQAAVAIQNAKLFAERRRSDEDVANLREALASLTAHVPELRRGQAPERPLGTVAQAVCEALGAISCVASMGGENAGAFGAGQVAAARPHGDERGTNANLVVARDPSGSTDLTLAVTLPAPAGRGPGRTARLRRRRHGASPALSGDVAAPRQSSTHLGTVIVKTVVDYRPSFYLRMLHLLVLHPRCLLTRTSHVTFGEKFARVDAARTAALRFAPCI